MGYRLPLLYRILPAAAKAIEQIIAEQGDEFSLHKITLAKPECRISSLCGYSTDIEIEDDALLCTLNCIFDDAVVSAIKGESIRGKARDGFPAYFYWLTD